jgi:hypothetical protein
MKLANQSGRSFESAEELTLILEGRLRSLQVIPQLP